MSRKSDKLGSIRYQLLKNQTTILTDQQKVMAVDSLYDAEINSTDDITTNTNLPLSVFGVSLTWENTHTATMVSNDYSLWDDFNDSISATIGSSIPDNVFMTNSSYFQTNGSYFVIR